VSGWHPHHLDGTFNTTQWPNLTFHCLFRRAKMFSFTWCDAWRCMVVGLSLMIISFFFISLLLDKIYNFPLCFLFFNFSSYSFDFFNFILIPFKDFFFVIWSFNYKFGVFFILILIFFILIFFVWVYLLLIQINKFSKHNRVNISFYMIEYLNLHLSLSFFLFFCYC
jgi:hypothetical protein